MEPGVKEYLVRILNTISIVGLCLMLNITAGIKYELAFVEEKLKWQNIAFYIFFLVSIISMILYMIKIWRKPLDFNQ
jgi:phosphatidylglycerophosphate synthase